MKNNKNHPLSRPDKFAQEPEESDAGSKKQRMRLLASGLQFDESKYEYKEDFVASNPARPLEAHTTAEVVEALRYDPKVQIEARVWGVNKNRRQMLKMDRTGFLEASKKRDSKKLREAIDTFAFSDDQSFGSQGGGGLIGYDFVPLLGGPFNKQLYYRDYLRMISTCFFAFHHDPIARDIVSIISDFTMGRGFKVTATGPDKDKAQILWDAFSKVNDIPLQFDYASSELSIYGETMWWKLPRNQTRISFNPTAGEKVPTGIIPRVRLIDPSNIAEIITIPEDMIKGVIAYVWLAPTQYQMWSDGKQPTTKFIYTQIPADQIAHYKINSVSNEKRGRSDYFPALGYMKRLRDSVNYSLVAQQKNAAWSIDTTIEGNEQDIDDYADSQKKLGPIPPAGSEFIHSKAVQRIYLANQGSSKGSDSPTFNWCMNMICMSSGIPISYFGTHLSGGNTRANALVSTEPIAKRFERRQNVYSRMVHDMYDDLMRYAGLNSDCDVNFPELITQDRTAKLQDLMVAQNARWLAPRTCADMASKEFDMDDYDYDIEQGKIADDAPTEVAGPTATNPLTAPAQNGQTKKSNGTMTAPEKNQVKNNLRQL